MKLKALLLGSATALAVAGGAQAADFSVAEPVDYVRVCDAFGTGYWYVPGTDVCIKIWGLVRWETDFYSNNEDGPDFFFNYYAPFSNGGGSGFPNGAPINHWDMNTNILFSVSAKSMTDWGPLEAYMDTWNWGWNEAWVSLGPLLAGWAQSTFNSWLSYDMEGNPYGGWYHSEHRANLIRLTWAMNGFGIAIALEELPFQTDYDGNYYNYYSSLPDIVAALTFSSAMLDGKVSFAYSDTLANSGDFAWAAAAGVVIKLDSIAPGDRLLLKAAYGAIPYTLGFALGFGVDDDIDTSRATWSVLASFKHYFAPNFYAAATGNYASGEDNNSSSRVSSFQAAFDLSYSPAPTLWITPGVRWLSYTDGGDSSSNFTDFMATVRIQKLLF